MQRVNDVNVKKERIEFEFGKPYPGIRKHSKFDVLGEDLVVVPVEIEVESMLYNLIQSDILSHFDAGHGMAFQGGLTSALKKEWTRY
jgi:hypothetical protein